MIRVSCPDCGLALAIPDNRGDSGSALRCKRCSAEINLESRSEVPRPAAANGPPKRGALPPRPVLAHRAAPAGAASVKHDPIEFDWNDLQAGTGPRPIAKVDSRRRPKSDASKCWVVELSDGVQETMQLPELCELFSHRTVGPGTRIRAPGAADWRRAPDIPELAAALNERGVQLLPRIDVSRDDDDADYGAPTSTMSASNLWAAAGVNTDDETAVMDSRRLVKEVFASVAMDDPSSDSAIPTVPPPADFQSGSPRAGRSDEDDDLTLLYQRDEEKSPAVDAPLAAEPAAEPPAAEPLAADPLATEPERPVDPFGPTVKLKVQAPPPGFEGHAPRSRLSNAAFIALAFLLGAIAFTAAAAATLAAYDLVSDDGSAQRR